MFLLREIPESLKKRSEAWSALSRVVTHLGEVPTAAYLEDHHPVLARAIELHGGLNSIIEDNRNDLDFLLKLSDQRHETSLIQWKKAVAGAERSREALVSAYRPLAKRIASRLYSRKLRSVWNNWMSVELEDPVQEGLVHFVERLPHYDPSRSRFPRFAHQTMESAMQHYLRDKALVIHESGWVQELRSKLGAAYRKFAEDHERKPSFEELAAEAGVSVEHVIEGFTHYQPVSMSQEFEGEQSGKRAFPEPVSRDAFEPLALKIILYKALRQHVKLSQNEAIALGMAVDGSSPDEIAKRLGVSYASAGSFVYQAKKKIRENLLFKHEMGLD